MTTTSDSPLSAFAAVLAIAKLEMAKFDHEHSSLTIHVEYSAFEDDEGGPPEEKEIFMHYSPVFNKKFITDYKLLEKAISLLSDDYESPIDYSEIEGWDKISGEFCFSSHILITDYRIFLEDTNGNRIAFQ